MLVPKAERFCYDGNMRRVSILYGLIILLIQPTVDAQKIEGITWTTRHSAPVVDIFPEHPELKKVMSFGLSHLTEPALMQIAGAGAAPLFGLPSDSAQELQHILTKKYQEVANDPLFVTAPSALAYCFRQTHLPQGYATLYAPKRIGSSTPTIVFLHGFGGSFLAYLHTLIKASPDAMIICPAYGISSGPRIPSLYLTECLSAVRDQYPMLNTRPTLIGISAGGFAGFHEYIGNEEHYAQYICLAAYPKAFGSSDPIKQANKESKIRILVGDEESFRHDLRVKASMIELRRNAPHTEVKTIAKHGHFFLWSAEKETVQILKDWLGKD